MSTLTPAELQSITSGTQTDVFSVLGRHSIEKSKDVIRAFLPYVDVVEIVFEDDTTAAMTRVH